MVDLKLITLDDFVSRLCDDVFIEVRLSDFTLIFSDYVFNYRFNQLNDYIVMEVEPYINFGTRINPSVASCVLFISVL